jgi:hypothetical protein
VELIHRVFCNIRQEAKTAIFEYIEGFCNRGNAAIPIYNEFDTLSALVSKVNGVDV